jgi:PTS system mannose-specific IIB component
MVGFVISHKFLAKELLETARSVIGNTQNVYAFSNHKLSNEELISQLNEVYKRIGSPRYVVLMVDLRGGNCWQVAKFFAHNNSDFSILSGVNLPMIFSFLTKRDSLEKNELVKVMENDAHRGIVLEEKNL